MLISHIIYKLLLYKLYRRHSINITHFEVFLAIILALFAFMLTNISLKAKNNYRVSLIFKYFSEENFRNNEPNRLYFDVSHIYFIMHSS